MKIDDETLMAYADGELAGAERGAVEQALAGNVELRDRLAEQKRLRSTLTAHYGPVAAEEVPDRLLTLLGADREREGVTSLAAARDRKRMPVWRTLGTIAASLAVGLLAGQFVPMGSGGPVAIDDGALVARGELADALETQLASTQPRDAATRIGVTFADRQGRFCRSFQAQAMAGLACRDEDDWKVLMTAPSHTGAAPQYRQAGSSLVLGAAQAMMAEAPLDAEAERAARAAEWKSD